MNRDCRSGVRSALLHAFMDSTVQSVIAKRPMLPGLLGSELLTKLMIPGYKIHGGLMKQLPRGFTRNREKEWHIWFSGS